MVFKYAKTTSLGCFKNSFNCLFVNSYCYFKKGKGFIFYKSFLDYNLIKSLKYILYYLNINIRYYNLYISIQPYNFKKIDNCIDLALFFILFLSFFKLNLNKKIVILGSINFKTGKIIKIKNIYNKIKIFKKSFPKLLIIPYENEFFSNNNFSILKFNYLYEIYRFLKRCLTQGKSNAITRRLSGVRFSQHL